ncbi:MAG: nucleotidyltransferase substrate binding protein, HI0074 family [Microgenomates group bacterium Gr01-1014_16]|nr:MAG: nucleotidyltransferase substrate binding protein, HI0074 family [Microgenomates group bacterium Gr01-1014_16]
MTYQDKLTELKMAFLRLKEALPMVKDQLDKDGVIQRFEFTFELVWKTLREFCAEKGKTENNPKDIFRLCADFGLLEDPQPWFDFLKNRNLASHLYDEEVAERIFTEIPAFVSALEPLLAKLENP